MKRDSKHFILNWSPTFFSLAGFYFTCPSSTPFSVSVFVLVTVRSRSDGLFQTQEWAVVSCMGELADEDKM